MSSIPEYTPERAYMFARERDAVRAKIAKTIDVSKVPDRAALEYRYDARVELSLKHAAWLERTTDCARFSGIEWDREKQQQLDGIAKTMVYRILDGDQMFRAAENRNTRLIRDDSAQYRAENMIEIYLNHITREGLSQVKSMGFSDRSSLSLVGQIIRKALPFAEQTFSVKPIYNSGASAEANLSKINTHWKLMRDVLNNDHAMNNLFSSGQQRH